MTNDANYFCATIEGEAPENITQSDVREQINENLPRWCEAHITRFDGE